MQGDGEVSGSAIEHSLAGTVRFTVHTGAGITTPWAEDRTHWIMMGIDWDPDPARRSATGAVIDFLAEREASPCEGVLVREHRGRLPERGGRGRDQVVVGRIAKALLRGR